MPPRIPQSSKIPLHCFRLSVCQSRFPQMSRAPPARVGVMGESHQHQMKTVKPGDLAQRQGSCGAFLADEAVLLEEIDELIAMKLSLGICTHRKRGKAM